MCPVAFVFVPVQSLRGPLHLMFEIRMLSWCAYRESWPKIEIQTYEIDSENLLVKSPLDWYFQKHIDRCIGR